MRSLLHDLRFASRSLVRNPRFATLGVLTLALGIGANAAMFSVVNGLLLRPLPVRDPSRLVALFSLHGSEKRPESFSYLNYVDLAAERGAFEGIAAQSGIPLSLGTEERADMVWGEMVTSNYFPLLGARPALGRFFTEADDHGAGSVPFAVLSYAFWKGRFGSDPGIVGTLVRLNGHSFKVLGVAPEGFTDMRLFLFLPDVWVPLQMYAQVMPGSEAWLPTNRGVRPLLLFGRLAPGVSVAQAQASATSVSARLASEHAPGEVDPDVLVMGGHPPFANPAFVPRGALVGAASMSLAGVGLVLAIACANVASLLLARTSGRRREVAIRRALGASGGRLARLLLTESLLLAFLGGLGGLLLAAWARSYESALVPPSPFRLGFDTSLDLRVLAFTALATSLATVLAGVGPAVRAARAGVLGGLKEAPPEGTTRLLEARGVLVVAQLAFSLVLLAGGGLLLKSLEKARDLPVGFDTRNALALSVNPGVQGYDEARGRDLYRRLVEGARSLPSVTDATLAFPLPLDFASSSHEVEIEGRAVAPEDKKVTVLSSVVDVGYFRTMRTDLVAGREFDLRDGPDRPPVAVVNETMARLYWPKGNALGGRLRVQGTEPLVEVVGIAKDGKYGTLGEDPRPYLFLPLGQNYRSQATLVVRSAAGPRTLAPLLRREVQSLDPDLAAFGVLTLEDFKRRSLSVAESAATFSATFGLLALALASVGVYGVISQIVGGRTREIGIRMALGATRSAVLRLILGGALRLAALGIAVGLLGALGLGRLLAGLLYGVSGADLSVFALAAVVLLGAALAAAYSPARRATRVDPITVVRAD
jgi:predicted permease